MGCDGGGREGELGRERRLVGPGETQSSHEKREGLWDGEKHKGEWGGIEEDWGPQEQWEGSWKREGDCGIGRSMDRKLVHGCRIPETCR